MIFLHVGLHKTGSTSIQRWLAANQRQGRWRQTAYLPESYTELGGKPSAKWSRRVVTRAQSQDVILSCEQALGSMRLCYRNLPERLEVLNEAFQGAPLTLILFLRPQGLFSSGS